MGVIFWSEKYLQRRFILYIVWTLVWTMWPFRGAFSFEIS